MSDAALTHPQRFKTFNFLQKPARYARAWSLKAEHPLMLSFVILGQPWARACRERSLSLKLLLRSRTCRSWQQFAIASTALSSSCGLSWRSVRLCNFVNFGARDRTKSFMFLLHLKKSSWQQVGKAITGIPNYHIKISEQNVFKTSLTYANVPFGKTETERTTISSISLQKQRKRKWKYMIKCIHLDINYIEVSII